MSAQALRAPRPTGSCRLPSIAGPRAATMIGAAMAIARAVIRRTSMTVRHAGRELVMVGPPDTFVAGEEAQLSLF